MVFSCDHALLTEGWVKEQGKEAALMKVWGNCHHLFWLLIWFSPCLHVFCSCRSCTSIMVHINGGSFAKLPRNSSPHLFRAGFGLFPKTSSCQVCAPAGPGTIQDLTTKPFSGRLCANPVATWEFTYTWVVCTT